MAAEQGLAAGLRRCAAGSNLACSQREQACQVTSAAAAKLLCL